MNPVREIDLGTPESPSQDIVDIEIDGLPATVKAGTTVHLSKWQQEFEERAREQGRILEHNRPAKKAEPQV